MINFIHPSLFLLLGVIFTFVPFFNKKLVLLLFALISFLLSLFLNYGASIDLNFLSFELQLFRVDFISKTFVIIFTLITLIASIYAINQKSILELRAAYLYVSAAIGAVLSGDLISLFVFWELMAIGSTLVILSNTSNKHSESSGLRYLLIHLLGGVILIVGIIGYASIEKNILFKGFDIDVSKYMLQSDFLLHCAVYPDPLPTVIFEAIQHELPVISTCIGGPVEILDHGNGGLLIPFDDAFMASEEIAKYIFNKKLVDMKKQYSTNYIKKQYSEEKFNKKILKFFNE